MKLFVEEIGNDAALQAGRRDELKTKRKNVVGDHSGREGDRVGDAVEIKLDGHDSAKRNFSGNQSFKSTFADDGATPLEQNFFIVSAKPDLHGTRTTMAREAPYILRGRTFRGGRKRKHKGCSYTSRL